MERSWAACFPLLASFPLAGLIVTKVTGQKQLLSCRGSHNRVNLYQTSRYRFGGLSRCYWPAGVILSFH